MVAKLPPPGTPNVLYLVDLSGYVFRAYHAIAPLSNSKGEVTHAVLGTVTMLQKVITDRRPEMLAVALDTPGRTFRHELDERYKATRDPAPPDVYKQMARAVECVRAFNIPVFEKQGLEADDLIAAVATRATRENIKIVIVSADKDMMQLVHDNDEMVVMWDSMRDKVYGPAEVEEKLVVKPSQVRDYLALCGDSSDNVPGVRSVGPKTASELLKEFGTLEGIYDRLPEIKREKLREALKTHEADARMSQKLVTLKADEPIEWDLAKLRYGGVNEIEVRRLFTNLEFTRLIAKLPPPPPTKHEYRTVTELSVLETIAARAKENKRLAFELVLSEPDPNRAAIIGVSLAISRAEGLYVPISHRYLGVPKQIAWADIARVLGPLFVDRDITKIAHDMKTNEVVLRRHDLRLDGPLFDTQLAAYLIDPEAQNGIVEIARRELGFEIPGAAPPPSGPPSSHAPTSSKRKPSVPFDQLEVAEATPLVAAEPVVSFSLAERQAPRIDADGLSKLWNDIEIPLSRVLAEMELTGVLVDTNALARIGKTLESVLQDLERKAKELAGRDFPIRSRDQLEVILFDDLKLPVLKRTPKGGRSTDADVLEELGEQHALPKVITEFREIDKLKSNYIDGLPRFVNPKTGRIHGRFMQTVAATGRLSSTEPNLQNIPVRSPLGREIRTAFVAPPGCVLVSADYSQIELRILAHLSQDPMLVETYRKEEDVHRLTASIVFEVPLADVTQDMRRKAKTINFGIIYGMGDNALARQLDITREDAKKFIETYFQRYKGVAAFMERTLADARQGETVRTLLGRRRFLPNLHSVNRPLRFEAERIAKNTPIQGTAADILKVAMVNLGKRTFAPGTRMVLTVHDELVFETKKEHAEEVMAIVKQEMANAVPLDVPLVVDAGANENWTGAH